MPWLERPNCQFGGIGGCNNPATRLVGFERSGRWFFSCTRHAEWWRNRGGYWVGDLMGRCGDPAVSEELLSYLRDEYDNNSCVCGAPERSRITTARLGTETAMSRVSRILRRHPLVA